MVELIASNAYRRLNELSVGSVKINAAVCYWTLPLEDLAPAFVSALRHKDSCLVVDIHSPTSIDSLEKLNLAGAHVFLYLFQIVGKTEVADAKGIPDHLMHAKIFVFDHGTSEIKIWIGSHNGTRRALLGLNFEFASIISCKRDSDLHLKALNFISHIKNVSKSFENSEIDLYKAIQSGLQEDAVIELQEPRATPLASQSLVCIFGTRIKDYPKLQRVGTPIYLSLTDSASGIETIYKATVDQTGHLTSRSEINFGPRRYAVKDGSAIPILETSKIIPINLYKKCKYFVNLKIDGVAPNLEAAEALEKNLWRDVAIDRYLHGVKQPIADQAAIYTQEREIGKFRVQGVNLGQAESIFETSPIDITKRSLKVLQLSERLNLQDQPLIRMRVLISGPNLNSDPDTEPSEND